MELTALFDTRINITSSSPPLILHFSEDCKNLLTYDILVLDRSFKLNTYAQWTDMIIIFNAALGARQREMIHMIVP